MSITGIIIAAAIVGGTGLFIGVFLGIAGKKFAVEVDEREEAIPVSYTHLKGPDDSRSRRIRVRTYLCIGFRYSESDRTTFKSDRRNRQQYRNRE